jgi:hypothetical protein
METVMELSVQLKVSIHSGKNWAEVHWNISSELGVRSYELKFFLF